MEDYYMKKINKYFLLAGVIFTVLLDTSTIIAKEKNDTLKTSSTTMESNNIKPNATENESLKMDRIKDSSIKIDTKSTGDNPNSNNNEMISLKIEKSNVPPFKSIENMILYAQKNYNIYDSLKVYFNLMDDNGVTAYYQIKKDGKTYYLVFYGDKAYKIESSSDYTDSLITSAFYSPSYEKLNEVILSKDNAVANLSKEYSFYKNSGEIEITQNGVNLKFNAIISDIEYNPTLECNHLIEVKNSDGETLIRQTLFAGSNYDMYVKVLDLNQDGYMDLQLLKAEGARNSMYDLYVYDKDKNIFVKVDIGNETLSTIEMRKGYICNWLAGNPELGNVTYYVIEGNKLVKKDGVHID